MMMAHQIKPEDIETKITNKKKVVILEVNTQEPKQKMSLEGHKNRSELAKMNDQT